MKDCSDTGGSQRRSKRVQDDAILDDLYSIRFKSEFERLRNSTSADLIDPSKLNCLPYILAANELELMNSDSYTLINGLLKQEEDLKSKVAQEKKSQEDLSHLNSLLDEKLRTISESSSSWSPSTVIKELDEKTSKVSKENKYLLNQLKSLMNNQVLDSVAAEDDTDRSSIRSQLRKIVENLLNEMFDKDSTGYFHVPDMDSPIVHFLLSGDLISLHPTESSYIRLRGFGQ